MRRIAIQVAMSPQGDGEPDIVVTCNDGTMWMLGHAGQWVELPGLPQDESKDPLAKLYARNVDLNDGLRAAQQTIEKVRQEAERLIDAGPHVLNQAGRALKAIVDPVSDEL